MRDLTASVGWFLLLFAGTIAPGCATVAARSHSTVSSDDLGASAVNEIADRAERFHADLDRRFGVDPASVPPVAIELLPDRDHLFAYARRVNPRGTEENTGAFYSRETTSESTGPNAWEHRPVVRSRHIGMYWSDRRDAMLAHELVHHFVATTIIRRANRSFPTGRTRGLLTL